MNKEEIEESPYCKVCGTCGYIDCCGIENFIDEHIKGKTDCDNEEGVISEIIDLCSYQTEVFKQNDILQSQLSQANDKIQQYKQQIDELEKWLENEKLSKEEEFKIAKDKYNQEFIHGLWRGYDKVLSKIQEEQVLSKLKERNEE